MCSSHSSKQIFHKFQKCVKFPKFSSRNSEFILAERDRLTKWSRKTRPTIFSFQIFFAKSFRRRSSSSILSPVELESDEARLSCHRLWPGFVCLNKKKHQQQRLQEDWRWNEPDFSDHEPSLSFLYRDKHEPHREFEACFESFLWTGLRACFLLKPKPGAFGELCLTISELIQGSSKDLLCVSSFMGSGIRSRS